MSILYNIRHVINFFFFFFNIKLLIIVVLKFVKTTINHLKVKNKFNILYILQIIYRFVVDEVLYYIRLPIFKSK